MRPFTQPRLSADTERDKRGATEDPSIAGEGGSSRRGRAELWKRSGVGKEEAGTSVDHGVRGLPRPSTGSADSSLNLLCRSEDDHASGLTICGTGTRAPGPGRADTVANEVVVQD